jgi:membrane-associated phospholipid phosphatase
MDRRRRRWRWLLQGVFALVLFGIWTSIVRDGIAHGSRESAWIDRRFGDWPEQVDDVRATFDLQFSIFATFVSGAATDGPGETIVVFGRPVIGTAVDGDDSQNIYGSRYTTGIRAGALESISVFVAAPVDKAPNDQFQLAIYDDSSGAPGRRLATTGSGRLVPDAWNTLPIRAVLQPVTSYWLMYNSNGTNTTVNNSTISPVPGDPLDNAIRSYPTQLGTRITSAGDMRQMVVAIVAISVLAARRRLQTGMILLAGFFLALLIAGAVRDTMFDPYLYPSGHALRATYVAVAFFFVVSSRVARLVVALLAALIAVYTVRTGSHYSEEVIGGVLLGWAIATAAKAVAGDATRASARASIDSPTVIDLTDAPATSRSEAD